MSTYNFTIHGQGKPNDASCYLWTEIDGGHGACEIATCNFLYLETLPQNITEVAFFSDTCNSQNRNQFLAPAYLYALQKIPHLQVIEYEYLVTGHTHMECDSLHAAIEFAKRHQKIYILHDWEIIIHEAWKQNPYKVNVLKYSDFLDFKQVTQVLVTNCNKTSDGTVIWMMIPAICFKKTMPTCLQYKYNFDEPYQYFECGKIIKKTDIRKN